MAIYDFQESKPRWFSFENREGAPGMGGQANLGAKGSPSGSVPAGKTLVLCHAQGEGILRRIWMTFANRTPEMLEDVRIRMRWDGAPSYAVDAPLGEFFCQGRWGMRPMENAFFASPEGRSLVCAIPMPFRQEACVELYNGAGVPVENLFYDVDLTLEPVEPQAMYFHCQYSQTHGEPAGIDFVWLSASGGMHLGPPERGYPRPLVRRGRGQDLPGRGRLSHPGGYGNRGLHRHCLGTGGVHRPIHRQPLHAGGPRLLLPFPCARSHLL